MLNYDKGTGNLLNWILTEENFEPWYQGKCESIMALGNGYLGVRAAFDEPYVGQTRSMFVAGTYNKCNDTEVTELPNAADITAMQIYIDSEPLSLVTGKIHEYTRYLNLKEGGLVREVLWESPQSKKYRLEFRRFVSIDDLHAIGARFSITPLSGHSSIEIKTGIDGRMTNSGSQHFIEGDKRVFDSEYIQLVQTTTQSKIDFVLNCCCSCYRGNSTSEKIDFVKINFLNERRSLFGVYQFKAEQNSKVTFQKVSNIFTSRDKQFVEHYSLENLKNISLEHIKHINRSGYDLLIKNSILKWHEYWEKVGIELESKNNVDVLALRFAQYHLLTMTPCHDERFNIGAKALTGEGYKGHVFWDTELFILPYFQFCMPEIAKQLIKYRYNNIEGARNKAEKYGYQGAMYPWETAFTGDEETPDFAAINILTGKPNRVWAGVKEHHVSADIPYAVWNYYRSSNDYELMKNFGFEIILECAWFWCSRVEWNENISRYVITDTIGPDEYTEHIDNNAYTNYMARYIVSIAIEIYNLLKEKDCQLFNVLNEKLSLMQRYEKYVDVHQKIYIPKEESNNIIPQDDTFLSKVTIDIEKYKKSHSKQDILLEYTRNQIIDMQVLKQADLVMLFFLFKKMFNKKVLEANWKYYEARTLHDSSLSMAIHSIVATYFNDIPAAYNCFIKACAIDMGQNMVSSDQGVHAASMGGIWMTTIFGFGGLYNNEGDIELDPALPDEWSKLGFSIKWGGREIHIKITRHNIVISSDSGGITELKVYGKQYQLKNSLVLPYEGGNKLDK